MKLLPLGIVVLAGLSSGAAACNFIYASQLKDYGEECKFEGRQTACGQCIVASCTPQVNEVCLDRYGSTLGSLAKCATDPGAEQGTSSSSHSYPCDTFKNNDAGPNGDPDQDLTACIRDNCIAANGPCNAQCAVQGKVAECQTCINDLCAGELLPMCGDRTSGSLFQQAESCASNPNVDLTEPYTTYPCEEFRTYDGGGVPDASAFATQEQNFKVCVRDKCITDKDLAPCRTCPLQYSYGQQTFELDASTCGQCIVSQCWNEVMHCCAQDPSTDAGGRLLHDLVSTCANPDYHPEQCVKAYNLQAASDAGCVRDLPECMRTKCPSQCAP